MSYKLTKLLTINPLSLCDDGALASHLLQARLA